MLVAYMFDASKMATNRPPKSDTGEEARFLARYDASKFEHPSVTVDVALVSVEHGRLLTLVLERMEHPAKGLFALPGGFVGMKEPLDAAAARVLTAKAGLREVFVEQLYTFGDPGRDPRTRVITVAYYALVDATRLAASRKMHREARIASINVPWAGETGGPVALDENGRALPLAFDHADILGMAVKRLRCSTCRACTRQRWASRSTKTLFAVECSRPVSSRRPARARRTSIIGPRSSIDSAAAPRCELRTRKSREPREVRYGRD